MHQGLPGNHHYKAADGRLGKGIGTVPDKYRPSGQEASEQNYYHQGPHEAEFFNYEAEHIVAEHQGHYISLRASARAFPYYSAFADCHFRRYGLADFVEQVVEGLALFIQREELFLGILPRQGESFDGSAYAHSRKNLSVGNPVEAEQRKAEKYAGEPVREELLEFYSTQQHCHEHYKEDEHGAGVAPLQRHRRNDHGRKDNVYEEAPVVVFEELPVVALGEIVGPAEFAAVVG